MIIDYCTSIGFALELLATSAYHKQLKARSYICSQILPALRVNQIRFYLTDQGIPTALVTWALLSEEVERELHTSGRSLTGKEWNCGPRLYFNDCIAPYGNYRVVSHDLVHNVFPDVKIASSLRRNADGTVRRINRWVGKNYLKET